ncbi:hypothetical protein GALL_461730 [mine drainage metagenome]|uniref:Uncharacterized protein n=1 Tax=mine drainage metagenome TaxID=410659 RepID=A0A1J5Q411_9ZZZZ
MDHVDLAPESFGELGGLPVGRGDRPLRLVEQQLIAQVSQPHLAWAVRLQAAELRIVAIVRLFPLVEELGVQAHARLGPDVLQEQGLAPAGMGDDDVGDVAGLPQAPGGAEGGVAANDLGLEVGEPGMDGLRGPAVDPAVRHAHAAPAVLDVLALGDGAHVVAELHQGRGQGDELTREVLVREEDVHRRKVDPGLKACLDSG